MSSKRKPRVPTLCRHKATGQAVVRLPSAAGPRDHYCGRFGTAAARARYDQLIGRWLANGRSLPAETDAPLALVELADRYMDHVERHYRRPDGRPGSEVDCIKAALRPLLTTHGRTPARDFGPAALIEVREAMIGQPTRLGKPPARVTINGNVKRIVRMFRWGVERELLPAGAWQALRAVEGLRAGRSNARETPRRRPIAEADLDSVLPLVSRHVGALLRLLLLTGMRPSEACAMRMVDLDRSGDVWAYRPVHHKTEHRGRRRLVALGPRAQSLLAPFLRADGGYLFQPVEAEQERNEARRAARPSALTRSRVSRRSAATEPAAGDCYSPASLRRAVERACDNAGIPRWTPGRLRHTAATRLRRQFGLEAARVALGHASPVVTDEFYAEIDASKALEVARAVG